MGWEHLLAFNLTLVAAILSPGPAMLYFMRVTLEQGRSAGLLTVAGLGVMATVWTATALMGLHTLFALVPWAYLALKTTGAVYLIALAIGIWRNAGTETDAGQRPAQRAFWGGVLVNMANPKSVLFAAAVVLVVFPSNLSLFQKGLILANHLAVEVLIGGLIVLAIARPTVRRRYLGAKSVLDRVAALVLGALGARLLVTSSTE